MPVLTYYISSLGFDDIKISGTTPFFFNASFMIRKDYKILKTLVDRVIKSIDKETKKEILNRYMIVSIQKGYPKKYVHLTYFWFGFIVFLLIMVLIISIVQLKKIKYLSKKLEYMAYYDKLTNIFNRRKFRDILDEFVNFSKRYKSPLSLIFLDIDDFKKVNDTYGHEVGDFILKEVVNVAKKSLRKSDVFGRWGGEEFLILLPNTDVNGAKMVAEKIRKSIEDYDFNGLKITISLGVTQLKIDDTIEKFVNRADMALYQAKKEGKNRVIVF